MATIVQQYNPWREQLAGNILGPLVGGMIQRGQEAEQNRKLNALRGALNERMTATPEGMIADLSTDPADVMPEVPKLGGGLSPWQGTFDNIVKPDMAQVGTWLQPQRTAGTANPQQVLAELLATPRFNMLNSQKAYEAMGPYLADWQAREDAAKQAQTREAQLKYLEGLAGAGSWDDYMRGAAMAGGMGYMPHQVVESMKDYALGRQLSPEAAARNALGWAELNSSNEHWDRNFQAGRDDVNYDRANPKPYYQADADGTLYSVSGNSAAPVRVTDGTALKLDPHQKAQDNGKLSDMDKNALQQLHAKQKSLQSELDALNDPITAMREEEDQQLKLVNEAKRAELRQQIEASEYEEYLFGVRHDPNNSILRSIAKNRGWPMPEELNPANYMGDGTAPVPQVQPTPGEMIADAANHPADVMPETPQAPVVPRGTTSTDVRPGQGQTVGVDMAPPTRAEYEAMCQKYGKETVDAAFKRDGIAIPR